MKEYIKYIINGTFDILDEELTTYVVMNKYDELPDTLPSDIDISVSQIDFKNLDRVVGIIGQKMNLLVTQKIWHNYRKCAYILTPLYSQYKFRLQLDFFSDFSVKSTPLLIPYQELQSKTRQYGRFTVPDYDIEFVFLLMRRIYKNDFNDEKCEQFREILMKDRDKVEKYLKRYFSSPRSEQIVSYLENYQYNQLKQLRGLLWKDLRELSRRQSQGKYAMQYWYDQLKRAVFRCKYPVGASIALLSPDGGGKSTIIENLKTTCWGSFHGIEVKYFRPQLLSNLGQYNPINPKSEIKSNPNPHDVVEDSKVKSFIRFMFYNIDFVLGGIWIKKKKIQKNLIIFDRYYYDYYVDLKRYKYSFSTKVPLLFHWIIPNPDLVFILYAKPEVLHSRKQELSLSELTRQLEKYKKSMKYINNAQLINVDTSIEEVVKEITEIILLFKAKNTARAMGIKVNEKGLPVIIE